MLKLLVGAVALTATLPAAATAESPEVQRKVVRFDDLNLSSPAGVAILERRIQSAARSVCGYYELRGVSLIMPTKYTNCIHEALASARQQVALKTGTNIRKG